MSATAGQHPTSCGFATTVWAFAFVWYKKGLRSRGRVMARRTCKALKVAVQHVEAFRVSWACILESCESRRQDSQMVPLLLSAAAWQVAPVSPCSCSLIPLCGKEPDKLLASAWPDPGCCGHSGRGVYKGKISLVTLRFA